jgi:hypothetical protein
MLIKIAAFSYALTAVGGSAPSLLLRALAEVLIAYPALHPFVTRPCMLHTSALAQHKPECRQLKPWPLSVASLARRTVRQLAGVSAHFQACAKFHERLVQTDLEAFIDALQAGAHVNEPASDGRMPLVEAARTGHDFVEAALMAGAVVDAREPETGTTALIAAMCVQDPEVCTRALVLCRTRARTLQQRQAGTWGVCSSMISMPVQHAACQHDNLVHISVCNCLLEYFRCVGEAMLSVIALRWLVGCQDAAGLWC